ncbi:hypothetical protein A2U01_0101175, partial [Trifolium medium]|nr:hypothetical protein [Trifolium medium]
GECRTWTRDCSTNDREDQDDSRDDESISESSEKEKMWNFKKAIMCF